MIVFTRRRCTLFPAPLAPQLIGALAAFALVLLLGIPAKAQAEETTESAVTYDVTSDADSEKQARKRTINVVYLGTTLMVFGVGFTADNQESPVRFSHAEVHTIADPITTPVIEVTPDIGVVRFTFQTPTTININARPFTLGLPSPNPLFPDKKPVPGDSFTPGTPPQVTVVPEASEWATFGMLSATLLLGLFCGRRRKICNEII